MPQHRNFRPPPSPSFSSVQWAVVILRASRQGVHRPTTPGASTLAQLHQTTSNVFAFDGEYIQHWQLHPTPATTFKTGNYIQQRELHPTALFALFSIPSAAFSSSSS